MVLSREFDKPERQATQLAATVIHLNERFVYGFKQGSP